MKAVVNSLFLFFDNFMSSAGALSALDFANSVFCAKNSYRHMDTTNNFLSHLFTAVVGRGKSILETFSLQSIDTIR
jgi:hypothetical protein